MLSLDKIVLPLDFSQRSCGAAHFGMAVARQFGSELVLLHVMLPVQHEVGGLEFGGAAMGDLIANRERFARQQLDEFLVDELESFKVRRVLLEGDPAQTIVRFAHDEHAGLMVMPTHGYGPFRRFILGSTTAKVLHDADCPVWTGVHLEDATTLASVHFNHVVCAVDLGPQTERALQWAGQFAKEFGARMTVVHAMPQLENKPGEYFDMEWRGHVGHVAREELLKTLEAVAADAEVCVESGEPAKAVARAASDLGADLLVIGRGSAAGFFGRLRANAYAIIRESPCPVVSV
jgi:nucleotide-binding universal stress UspA family protein